MTDFTTATLTALVRRLTTLDTPKVVIITGLKGVGKSTLLQKLYEVHQTTRPTSTFERSFASVGYGPRITLEEVLHEIRTRSATLSKPVTWFLDEIDQLPDAEKLLMALRAEPHLQVFATSTRRLTLPCAPAADVLSVSLFPLTFLDFLALYRDHHPDATREAAWEVFLAQGALPVLALLNGEERESQAMRCTWFDSGMWGALQGEEPIRDPVLFGRLMDFMRTHTGSPLSARSISRSLSTPKARVATETVVKYLERYVATHWLIPVEREALREGKRLRTAPLFYAGEHGLLPNSVALPHDERALAWARIENIVLLALLRRGFEVTMGYLGRERVGFVARRDGLVQLIRVTTGDERHGARLLMAKASAVLPTTARKILLSLDTQSDTDEDIDEVNVLDFLLDEDLSVALRLPTQQPSLGA